MEERLICHVCGKEKKPYVVFLTDNIFSYLKYEEAREKGEICQRCDQYFAMTGKFKDATEKEFEIAKKSVWFAQMMFEWWEKDKKLNSEDDILNLRSWDGTEEIRRWCREKLKKIQQGEEKSK